MAEVVEQKPFEVTLGDGTVVKAANIEEAFKTVAKMKEDTAAELKRSRDSYKTVEQERDRYQQDLEKAKHPPVTNGKFDNSKYYEMLNNDPIAAQNYLDAARFGFDDPTQVVPAFNGMRQQVDTITQQSVVASFFQQHAEEFPPDPEAAKALTKRTAELIQSGMPFNLRTVNVAYREVVEEGLIKPVEAQQEEEQPNPNMSGGGGGVPDDVNKADVMSDKDLEALLRSKGMIR